MSASSDSSNVTSIHREVSLNLLQHSSCFALRTPRGQKDPGHMHWDPRNNTRDRSNEVIRALRDSDENIAIHLFGIVVDVDVDTDDMFTLAALDYFLPRSSHIWGRASKPRSHRLYELKGCDGATFDRDQYRFLSEIQPDKRISVEVRGGDMKRGMYTLMPGSIHPSGEEYQWASLQAARAALEVVNVHQFMASFRFALAASLVARYWTEGHRNELCKCLSGFLYRASTVAKDLQSETPLTKEDAKRILECVLTISGDEEEDRSMRLRTFDQTWQKGESGENIVGATRFTQLTDDKTLLPTLYLLLADTKQAQALDEVFEQYAQQRNKAQYIDIKSKNLDSFVMSSEDLKATMAGQVVTMSNGSSAEIFKIFVNSLRRRIVDRFSYDPTKPEVYEDKGETVVNTWRGWGIPPADSFEPKDIQPFITYLDEVVCSKDPVRYQWVLQWIADIFQNPATKPGTALVLVGSQGAGKTFLSERILHPILGDLNFTKVAQYGRLTDKFNKMLACKLVISAEEVMNSNRRVDSEVLKDMITSKRREVEPKGKDVFSIPDHSRYVFTSNNIDNAVHVGRGDRRYSILRVADTYCPMLRGDPAKKFWRKMFAWATINEGQDPNIDNLAKLHAYLLTVKVDRSFISTPLETAEKKATAAMSTRGMDAYLLHLIGKESPFSDLRENDIEEGSGAIGRKGKMIFTNHEWPDYVLYSQVERAYEQFVGHTDRRSALYICKFLKDAGMLDDTAEVRMKKDGKAVRYRPFPSKASVLLYLQHQGYDTSVDHLGTAENEQVIDEDTNGIDF